MAKAPTPGVGKRAEEVKAAKKMIRLTIRGEQRVLASVDNLPFKERVLCREDTGKPVEFFIEGGFGIDSLQVVWWLAGRAGGNKSLRFQQVLDEWPDDLTEDDIDLTEITADDSAEDGADPQS